jgi:hypothetical protein
VVVNEEELELNSTSPPAWATDFFPHLENEIEQKGNLKFKVMK